MNIGIIKRHFRLLFCRSFKDRINREIFDHIFPHTEAEKDCGYPFHTSAEMNAQTESLDVHGLLDEVERQIRKMPKGYGESFRYLMHKDLHARLSMYAQVAERRIQPTHCDPRLVARHA